MAVSVKAIVKAELLVWARESAQLGIADAARKAQVKEQQLSAWERGEGRPSIAQLRRLGRVYKRPLAVFYLPKRPMLFQVLRDFRRLPQEMVGRQTPQLAFEVRRARARREIALDLYQELWGEEPMPFSTTTSLDDDPERVGDRLRELLGVLPDESKTWRTSYDAFNRWRSALELAGVLVFQAEDIDVGEMRGFSLSESLLPVIVVNIKDVVVGRIFSMLHEATHLMLREGGLCDLLEERSQVQERIEPFCNRVAAAALMPKVSMLEQDVLRAHKSSQWSNTELTLLAQHYRVSREAVLRRLLTLGRTTEELYRKKRRELQAEFEARQEELEQRKALGLEASGYAPPDRMVVSIAGPYFVRLVLESYHQEKITANDLSSFLEVRLKHLPKIEHAVQRGQAAAHA